MLVVELPYRNFFEVMRRNELCDERLVLEHKACRAYATSMTSVCPSVTLVDCDHIAQ